MKTQEIQWKTGTRKIEVSGNLRTEKFFIQQMGYRLDGYRLERANEKISKLEDWSLENVCIEVKRKKNGKNRKAPIRHETQ